MQNKKSQMQMIETISVLFVFFILIAIGFVFFGKVQGWGIKEQIEESIQKRAIDITNIASFMPELGCGEEGVEKVNCVDIEKIKVVGYESTTPLPPPTPSGIFYDNMDYYFDIFGYAKIEVEQIYPLESFNYIIYNKDLPDYRDMIKTQVPILLKDPIDKKYNFGLMTITTYSK